MLDEITFRLAKETDAETIKQMVHAEHLDPTSLKWQNFRVAEHQGRIVAIGQVKRYPHVNELGSLVTLANYRGKGIASALIQQLEDTVGFPLYLLCAGRMEAYYERFGYQTIRWRDAPAFLQLKTAIVQPFRLVGLRVCIMQKLEN